MRAFREGGYRALEELRRSGIVLAVGIGVNEQEVLLEALGWGDWDAFLLAGRYTLLEQAPLDELLPKCLSSGVSIVVGGPLNSGILAGRDTWNYKAAPPEVMARVDAIRMVCDSHHVPLAAAALQFPLAHPAVAAIIPGPRSVAEFEERGDPRRPRIANRRRVPAQALYAEWTEGQSERAAGRTLILRDAGVVAH